MDWEIRREILEFAHRWQITFLVFLLGSLLGFGLTYLFPAPYRAEVGLSVLFNPDVNPRNPDDYKNWFLEQLDVFVLSDIVLEDTLARLQAQDSTWQRTSREELRAALHAYWRSAGQWRLVAEMPEALPAEQAAQAWREAILSRSGEAIAAAARMQDLSYRYQEVVRLEAASVVRLRELENTQAALKTWLDTAQQSSDGGPLDTLERWRLLTLAARVVALNPVDLELLKALPSPDANRDSYLPWVKKLMVSLEQNLSVLHAQQAEFTSQRETLTRDWTEALQASGGLSAHLSIEPMPGADRRAETARTPEAGALIGGVIGLLFWLLIWLGRPLRKAGR